MCLQQDDDTPLHHDSPMDEVTEAATTQESESMDTSSEKPYNHAVWLFEQDYVFSDDEEEEDNSVSPTEVEELLDEIEGNIDDQEMQEILDGVEQDIDAAERAYATTRELFPVRVLTNSRKDNSRIDYCAAVVPEEELGDEMGDASSTWDVVAMRAQHLLAPSITTNIPRGYYEPPNDNNFSAVTAAVSKLHHQHQQVAVRTKRKLVRATKQVPNFFTTALLQKDYLQPFAKRLHHKLRKSNSNNPSLDDLKQFRVRLKDGNNHKILVVKGHATLVQEFRQYFFQQFQAHLTEEALQKLLTDPSRFEVDVKIPNHALLFEWNDNGALLEISSQNKYDNNRTILGLGVDWKKLIETSPLCVFLESLLGTNVLNNPGLLMAIRRLEYRQPQSARDWQRERMQLLKHDAEDVLVVTLAISPFVDLAGLNTELVVGQVRRANINRQQDDNHSIPTQLEDQEEEKKEQEQQARGPIFEESETEQDEEMEDAEPEVIHIKHEDNDQETETSPPEIINVGAETVLSELDSQLPSEDDPRVNKAEMARARSDAYNTFVKKFTEVYNIEYKLTDIKHPFVKSQMWSQHKKLIGNRTCEEDCKCPLLLDQLTQNIVGEYMVKRLHKDPGWKPPANLSNADESPVGFVNHFAPKFLPQLQEAFPKDTPVKILERLFQMWRLHLRQANFGNRCNENCGCGAGWKLVFHEGKVLDKETKLKKQKKPPVSNELQGKIQRKRPASSFSENESKTSGEESAPIKKKRKPSATGAASLLSSTELPPGPMTQPQSTKPTKHSAKTPATSTRASYSVSFNTSQPLGFYCVTEKHQGKSVCVIASVCPTSQNRGANSNLIQEGTCVEAVGSMQGNQSFRQPIKGHAELRHYYNNTKGSITLWFVNSMVQNASKPATHKSPGAFSSHPDWNGTGKWRGQLNSGWPGGADVISYRPPNWHDENQNGVHHNGNPHSSKQSNHALAQPAATMQQKINKAPPTTPSRKLAWSQVSQTRHPSHRDHRPDFSILKKATEKKQSSRKVRFDGSNGERVFDKDSASLHWLELGRETTPSTVSYQLTSPRRSIKSEGDPRAAEAASLKSIVKAVRGNNADVFLDVLQDGHIRTDSIIDGENWLSREYQFAKNRGLHEIQKALTIHRAARSVLDSAQSLRCWSRFVVKVEKIIGILPKAKGMLQRNSFDGAVSYVIMESSQKLPPLPTRNVPDSGVVDYRGTDGSFPEYTIHYNSGVSEWRALAIDLQSTGDRKTLASFTLPIAEVAEACYKSPHKPVTFERECRVGNGFVPGIKIRVTAKKDVLEKEYLAHKRDHGCKEVSKVLNWIERFNEEYREHSTKKLKAQICGRDNFSLLHAAVVFENKDLVSKTLSLGADPNAKSGVGSAVTFAMSTADRAREKLQNDHRTLLLEKGPEALLEREEQVKRLEEVSQEVCRHANESRRSHDETSDDVGEELRVPGDSTGPPAISRCAGSRPTQEPMEALPSLSRSGDKRQLHEAQPPPPQQGSPSADRSQNNGSNSTGELCDKSVAALCKAVGSKMKYANDWVLESVAATDLYKLIGKRNKDARVFATARDTAFSRGLIEYGRRNLAQKEKPIVKCGAESSFILMSTSNLSNDRFFRLARGMGKSPDENGKRDGQSSAPGKRSGSGGEQSKDKDAPERQSSALGKRKISPASGSQPPTKRPANPIVVQGLQQPKAPPTLPAPVAVGPSKAVPDTTPVEVLGGVAKLMSTESNASTLPKGKEEDRNFILFLESVWNSIGEWTTNGIIARLFYKKLGSYNKKVFKEARKEGTARGFVKWGRQNMQLAGHPVVECGIGQKEGFSFDTYLLLSDSGLRFLLSNGFREADELTRRQNLEGSPSPEKQDNRNHHSHQQDSTARPYGSDRNGFNGHRDSPPSKHSTRDMEMFLDSIVQNGDDREGWCKVKDVINEFFRRVGNKNESLLIDLLFEANRRDLLEWADGRYHDRILRDPRDYRSVLHAPLRLTRAGECIAQRRDDADNYHYRERRSSTRSVERSSSYDDSRGDHRHERRSSHHEREERRPSLDHGSRDERRSRHHEHRHDQHNEAASADRSRHPDHRHEQRNELQERRPPVHQQEQQNSNTDSSAGLPMAKNGRYWCTLGGNVEPCKQHDCHCSRPHVSPPVGRAINSIHSSNHLKPEQVSYREENNLFTAAYCDRSKNLYYLAEGGSTGRKNSQGVYWYPSQTLARRALEVAVAASETTATARGVRSPPPALEGPPQQWRGAIDPPNFKKKRWDVR